MSWRTKEMGTAGTPATPAGSSPRSRLLRHAPAIALAAVLLLSYFPVLRELVRDWARDPNYSHGFLIPLISGFLIWRRRHELKRERAAPAWFGFAGLLLALAVFVLGSAGAEVFTQRLSLLLTLAALVLFLYGWNRLRMLGFPLALLLLAIPLPYVIYYGLTAPLQAIAARCAIWGLQIAGVPALAEGNVIHLPQTSLAVAEACSGIRSLYAFLALGALVAYFTPVPIWGRLAIFLVTIPLSVAGNAVRVWATGLGAYLIGPEVTDGTPHELFGIFVFAVSLGLFLLVKQTARRLWPSAR